MTALYFAHLDAPDRVSVKPHASPVFHAIQYLLGNLDRVLPDHAARAAAACSPTRAGPRTRTASTSPPGRSASARPRRCSPRSPAATSTRTSAPRPRSRFIALIGDAELDEGNIWEAIADPATEGLGNVHVDRRPEPAVAGPGGARRPDRPVGAAVRRGRLARGRGQVRRAAAGGVRPARRRRAARLDRRDAQRALPVAVRPGRRPSCASGSCDGAPGRGRPRSAPGWPTTSWPRWSPTSAGTTSPRCSTRSPQCDAVKDRPSVVFAYTVKGWGLPIAGNPRNHSALLTAEQIDELRDAARADRGDRVGPARPDDPGRAVGRRPARAPGAGRRRAPRRSAIAVPDATGPARRPSRSRPRRRSAGSWSTCPGTRRSRRTWSPPRRTWPPRPTWPASSTGPGCSAPAAAAGVERGPGAEVGRGPDGPAHRARHLAR